jgi:hypothetical protein
VAEGGGLLNRYTLSRRIEGSNPSLSASGMRSRARSPGTSSNRTGSVIDPPKALPDDLLGRFGEVISDPLNPLIERIPTAGVVEQKPVYLPQRQST